MMFWMYLVSLIRVAWDTIRDAIMDWVVMPVAALGPVAHLLIIVVVTTTVTRLLIQHAPLHRR